MKQVVVISITEDLTTFISEARDNVARLRRSVSNLSSLVMKLRQKVISPEESITPADKASNDKKTAKS